MNYECIKEALKTILTQIVEDIARFIPLPFSAYIRHGQTSVDRPIGNKSPRALTRLVKMMQTL